MNFGSRIVFLLLALSLSSSAMARKFNLPAEAVRIIHSTKSWTAEFTFRRSAPVWVFSRSALTRESQQSWRQLSWTVLTPGVSLKRIGNYDALVADRGNVPAKIRIRFEPYANGLLADYDPALQFTDGSVALFTEHYNAIPVQSEAAAAALPPDLTGVPLKDSKPATVTFRETKGDVLFRGKRARSLTLIDGEGYVVFGKAKLVDAPAIATILDRKLPPWLSSELATFTPRLLSFYAARMGPRSSPKPEVMASWAGATPGMRSMGGSVLPGLIIMRFEGDVVAHESKAVRDAARWFIAHESAHFWAGQTVHYASPNEAWITEGGADLLAMRAVSAIDPSYDAKAELQRSLDDCVKLAGKPISSAAERNEHRAYYACGAIFGLAAEAAMRRHGGDFFGFWRQLIADNKADGVVDRSDWLAELTKVSSKPQLAQEISALLDKGAPEPATAIAALLRDGGVAYTEGPDGRILLQ